jgi:hypothetical protein
MNDKEQKQIVNMIAELSSKMTEEFRDVKTRLVELEKKSLTKDETDELLAMARHYNKLLEDDARGKRNIMLEREEYDAAAEAKGFENRFVRTEAA